MFVVVDPYYGELGAKVSLLSGIDVMSVEHKVFPDGEYYFRVSGSVTGSSVGIIIGCSPWQQNDCIIRSFFLSKTMRDLGARKIVLVMPYFPYSRQDKRFLSGECISAKFLAEILIQSGTDVIATIDVHSMDVFNFLGEKFVNLVSDDIWVNYFVENFGKDFFLVSPDEGRLRVIKRLSERMGVPYTGFKKVRDLHTGSIIGLGPIDEDELKELSKSYDKAILFDDIISTGGTAAKVVSLLRNYFDGQIITAFTHGLFLPGSVEKLLKAGVSKIVATDTVRNAFSEVSVAPLISRFLKDVLST